jgi:hypothetical protein
MNVGWDPVVTAAIATWDGGKALAGFGKTAATLYGGWVFKMWGTLGTKPCAANSAITGYVTMLPVLYSSLTPANCALSANAEVQWAWTT